MENQQQYICQSSAVKDYGLTLKELEPIEYKNVKNPKNKHNPIKLYDLNLIHNIAINKHGSIDNAINYANRKKELTMARAISRSDKREDDKIFRKNSLINKLQIYNLELRNDSKLCSEYIDGTLKDWTEDQVVSRMCQMKYLFDYRNMSYYLDKAYSDQKEEKRAGYYPDMTIFEQAEYEAMKNHKYPHIYPWINAPINKNGQQI